MPLARNYRGMTFENSKCGYLISDERCGCGTQPLRTTLDDLFKFSFVLQSYSKFACKSFQCILTCSDCFTLQVRK